LNRRNFLKFSSAGMASTLISGSGLLSWATRTHAAIINKTFYITEGFITQPDGVDVYFRGFSNDTASLNTPGAQLIAQEGDTVSITVINTLTSDHNFVIEGVVDSGVIAAGTSKTFEFIASSAGSYMYYDNLNAPYNRLSGLHGGFAVMPSGSSTELFSGSATFVQQYFWLTNDIDPVWNNNIGNGITPTTAFVPRYFTINGRSMRVPDHPEYGNPDVDSGYAPDTRVAGSIGDRALIRIQNAGLCTHAVHFHANHVEWLARNGAPRSDIWKKDTIMLPRERGSLDVIYPFESPPNAWPAVTQGQFPMHFHDEMTQTAGGGSYQFGLATTISFE